ncbi:MAG: hypothetical protein WBH44_03985 [Proteocatella sp.]
MNNNVTSIVMILMVVNMTYVAYSFVFKKNYYENIFITIAIFTAALVIEPINASFKFNAKYGFSILDLMYYGIILYVILASVLRNNNFFMINMSWDQFYKIIKEIFRKKGIDTYYRIPTIYINDTTSKIELRMNLAANSVIMVKFTDIESVIDLKELKKMINQEFNSMNKNEFKSSRYFYLLINVIMTILLLSNLK